MEIHTAKYFWIVFTIKLKRQPSSPVEKIYVEINQPIRNKSRLWWPCLLIDRDKMSILYRGPSIDASYQELVHFPKRFQRKRFLKIGNICIENCILNTYIYI